MKKRILALLMAMMMAAALCACGGGAQPPAPPEEEGDETAAVGIAPEDLRIGLIMISDSADAYSGNHIEGMYKAIENLGLDADTNLILKTNVGESADCDTAIRELAEAGCQIIFSNSFGHEQFMVTAAPDFPEIQFCAATGYQSALSPDDNTYNYFARIYEARYLSGIAAGLKTESNMIGYVAAKPFAEVISGYTAFYLGAKSVNPDVVMYVNYTDEWSHAGKEATNAQALIDMGCDVIGQHSDTSAPSTTAEAAGVWSIGYNDDMIPYAPGAALVSARIDWSVYYTFALACMLNGDTIPQDWCEGLSEGAVYLSPLNEALIAEGTADAINLAMQALLDGSVQVFQGPLMNVDGTVAVEEGAFYFENENASAPSWDKIIEGINVLS